MQRHTLSLLLAGLIVGGSGCDRQSPDGTGAPADESALPARVIEVGSNDIAGVVTGPDGPEAGVWVIAETEDLPTRFARIVVTDDAGRFLVPDLPAASYRVWVRGYGLADSEAMTTLPAEQPSRPHGIERNVVITQWDWADPKAYLHDLVSTDRRDPTVNADGKLYGVLENSADYLPVLDPETHMTDSVALTTLPGSDYDPEPAPVTGPSVYWGEEPSWDSATTAHNPMLDAAGRVWVTARVRDPENSPDFCREGSEHPSAQAFPVERSYRHLGVYDPAAEEYTPIDTCFSTHHLMFAEDDNDTLWTSGGGDVVGWLNVAEYLKTGDAMKAQGWTATVLDTNGNGQRDSDYTEPGEAIDPHRDARIRAGFYGVAPAPDGAVWGSTLGYPGGLVRLVPGDDPARTAIAEYYEPPLNEDGSAVEGFSPRGMDIDRNGVAWAAMASGHMASFDRRLCQAPLNGPEATGQHCPEGWTFYPEPLPKFRNQQHAGSAEGSYYTWVDQFNTLGLGENTPINTGNLSEALLVLHEGEWVRLRVPYPLGFYTKWLDGRIDDPDAGWKGRGLWATFSSRAPFHMETGAGTTSKVYHFQLRPDPLAR